MGSIPSCEKCSGTPTYDGVVDMGWAGNLCAERLDILDPSIVLLEAVGRKADELYATSSKVFGTASDFTKLSGADGGEVIYERTPVSIARRSGMGARPYRDGRRE